VAIDPDPVAPSFSEADIDIIEDPTTFVSLLLKLLTRHRITSIL
jgi:electron transfer flavoprotein alpha subunit